MENILNTSELLIWWKFENSNVTFLVECYANAYASIGFGSIMQGGDMIVI